MSQSSKINLEGIIQKEIFDHFSFTFSVLQNPGEIDSFLNELLTKTERMMLAKRLAIAVLLTKGYSYRDIRKVLKVSFPTIRSIQFWLDHGSRGYKSVVIKILEKDGIETFIEKIDKQLDKENEAI